MNERMPLREHLVVCVTALDVKIDGRMIVRMDVFVVSSQDLALSWQDKHMLSSVPYDALLAGIQKHSKLSAGCQRHSSNGVSCQGLFWPVLI